MCFGFSSSLENKKTTKSLFSNFSSLINKGPLWFIYYVIFLTFIILNNPNKDLILCFIEVPVSKLVFMDKLSLE
jgi:hypothetical protein